MPVNPHVKGGSDVPVTDGGTGASAAGTALTNLGGLSAAAHAVLSHTGIPGVGDLTTAAHAALDHSAIPGANGGRPVTTNVTIPANSLSLDGQMLLLFVRGTCSAWTGTLTINGVTVYTPNSFDGPGWTAVCMLTRTSSGGAVAIGVLIDDHAMTSGSVAAGAIAGLNWTAGQTIAVGASSGSASITHVAAAAMR